jgi:hypothetical protein
VIEPGLVRLQRGDEAIPIGISDAVEPVEVAAHRGEDLGQERVAAVAVRRRRHRFRQDRGLNAIAEIRSAVGNRVRLQHLLVRLALPEGDVGDETVRLRVLQQAAHLGAGALAVDVGEGNGMEAGVPEPLERIGAGRWADEIVLVPAPGRGAALAVALVEGGDAGLHPLQPRRHSSHSPSW